jgi:hypothetical protein
MLLGAIRVVLGVPVAVVFFGHNCSFELVATSDGLSTMLPLFIAT